MKLVYLVNRIDGPGGLERVLSVKASLLADEYGYDVHIITLNQDKTPLFYEFSPKITYHNIDASGNKFLRIFKYMKGMRAIIKKIKPQIISVCDDGFKGFFVPIVISKPCPMVYERHVSIKATIKNEATTVKKAIGLLKIKLMQYGAHKYDRFIVLTNGNLNEWKLNNLEVIANPLSFYPKEQSNLSSKKVLAVGKQSFQKGYDRLLKSWKLVAKKHSDWILDIYGTIDAKEKLDDLAYELGITSSVNFYAPVKDIGSKYQDASIYVMSSRYEGFGMVLIEAMAYGVPCVSFDCPYGPSDIIENNDNGFLIENGDTNTLGEKIITLIEDDNKRSQMGIAARKSIDQFKPQYIVSKWDNLFKKIGNKQTNK